MMNWTTLILLVGVTLLGINRTSASHLETKSFVPDIHYEQHSSSVKAARKTLEERLGQHVIGSSSNLVDCGLCEGGYQHSHKSDIDSLSVGHGVVGFTGGNDMSSSSRYAAGSTQTHQMGLPVYIAPSSASESSMSKSEYSARRTQLSSSPIIIPVVGNDEKSYAGKSEKYYQSKLSTLPVYSSSNDAQYLGHADHISTLNSPMNSKVSQSHVVPVYRYGPSRVSENYNERMEQQRLESSVPVTYPIYTSTDTERYQAQGQKQQIHSTVPVYTPSTQGSEHNILLRGKTSNMNSASYVPGYTQSGSSQRFSQNSGHASISNIPVYPVVGESEQYSQSERLSHLQGGRLAVPLYPTSTYDSHLSNTGLRSHLKVVPSSGSSGFGLHQSSNTLYDGTSSDLSSYMSESERLAKIQSQSIESSGLRAGSSVVDSEISGSNQLAGINGGGFHRSKSWESSSKWASGSQYGTGVEPKNFNYLSTAEKEHHNINGKQAGYKAATTTLDDNGKVSTYSIHTR